MVGLTEANAIAKIPSDSRGDSNPKLNLTQGQVLWTLSRGMTPNLMLVDQLRYLRRLGVPFIKSELGSGKGNRVRYRYEHLVEVGVAVFALQRGMKPREVSKFLIEHRKYLRTLYSMIKALAQGVAVGTGTFLFVYHSYRAHGRIAVSIESAC